MPNDTFNCNQRPRAAFLQAPEAERPTERRVALVGEQRAARGAVSRLGAGWHLREYPTAAAALQGTPHFAPAFILIQSTLPDGSGTGCARELNAALPGAHIIMFFSKADAAEITGSFAAGVRACLFSPATQDQKIGRAHV